MFKHKLKYLLPVLALLFAACGSGDDTTTTTAAAGGDGGSGGDELVIGVSWNNFNEPRWANFDEPAIKAALEVEGARYISTDAGSSAEQQLADVENLITQGADALIILAQDGTAILPAVQSALDQGIPVVAYDRLIENPGTLYVTFDNVEVGRAEARVIFDLVPTGVYAIIKGNSADANADFLRAGFEDIIGEAVAAGDITICCETYTDNWDTALAQTQMEQFLTQENNAIDAVLSENDGMATGVVAALEAVGLAGSIPVSGQDADFPALNRVALGTQAVSVWKDARELGKAAGEAALALAKGGALTDVAGTVQFDSPGGNSMTSILLTPVPITQDNLNLVLDAGWITEGDLCQNVPSGTVDVCP
jgi:D-xylose transport system substrate-binding protein